MNILEELFGSTARIRIFNLFLKNEGELFEKKDVVKRTKLKEPTVRGELDRLRKIKLLKVRSKNKVQHFTANPAFLFYKELKDIIEKSKFEPNKDLAVDLKKIGDVQFAVIAGTLLNDEEAEADILIVGKGLDEQKAEFAMKKFEAQVGQELRYSLMTVEEFMYRCEMYDRFTIGMLKGPHREVVNLLPKMPKQAIGRQ